jgi:hypothetical protein
VSAVNLIVGDPGALTAAGTWIQSRLVALGHTVTLLDDSALEVETGDLVLIAPSVNGSAIGTKYRTSRLPVLSSFGTNWDDLNLTTVLTASGQAGTTVGILAAAVGHPLAAGLTGTVTTNTTSGTAFWYRADTAYPAGVVQIAGAAANALRVCIVGAETGAVLADGTSLAQNRRVGFGFQAFAYHDGTNPNLTANGISLFDAAVAWALAGVPMPPPSLATDFYLPGVGWTSGITEAL